MYTNYIFNLYGTIIDVHTSENDPDFWNKMTVFYGYHRAVYTPKEFRRTYAERCSFYKHEAAEAHPEYSKVDFDLTKVFRDLYLEKGIEPTDELVLHTAATFRAMSTDHIKLYDGVLELLDALKEKGKKIYLLSNAQSAFARREIELLGIKDYFDDILISSEEQCAKPDEHFLQALFDRNNLNKAESILIGHDCVCDIRGAYDFGLKSLYIHQAISPPISEALRCSYMIMDGDVSQIKDMIII